MKKTITLTGLLAFSLFATAGYISTTQNAMAVSVSMPQNLSKHDQLLALELNRSYYITTYGKGIDELRQLVMNSDQQIIKEDGSLRLN